MKLSRPAGLLAVAGLLLAAPSAQAAPLQFTYVASHGSYSDLERPVARQSTPAGRPAALGYFSFVTSGTSFTLRLQDSGVAPGATVPVFVSDRRTTACLAVGQTRRFGGYEPGTQVTVRIASAMEDVPTTTFGCTGFGTVGSAFVGR